MGKINIEYELDSERTLAEYTKAKMLDRLEEKREING